MPWNEPGGGNQDPWGQRRKPQGGPPDLDDLFKQFKKNLGGIFGGGNSGGGNSGSSGGGLLAVSVLAVIGVLYFAIGFYTVDEKEKALVLRFGQYNRTEGAGLHWRAPLVEQKEIVNTTALNQEVIRGRMLTEDEFLVEVALTVQYRISDPLAFRFNIIDPDFTVTQVAETALRSVIGRSTLDSILTVGTGQIQSDTREEMRKILDGYEAGIDLADVNLQERTVPEAVREAFDDAIKAGADQERVVKEAESYQSKEIPLAEAKAQRVLQDAEAYKQQQIAQAKGEVQRFEKLLPQYLAAPDVTRNRLYIETMEEIMSKVSKVMVDADKGNNMLYLPLDKMSGSRRDSAAAAAAAEGAR
ncbi:FtsH protease activity modulator HflK [Permianibacter sp. IMCC34836]|uniref:FtsH protease activity modulator HflK n=1 Tax=Permianibacter fluminis TaxID=2738515 RepID=UPI001551E2C6|nr:FtsH protease activity modulator HflK [Permianibacter fluminis]NQD38958.1 FtsH protease activity modulator HflK [Permianibacter fluminis]